MVRYLPTFTVALLCLSTTVNAQDSSQLPDGALFGSGSGSSRDVLTLSIQLDGRKESETAPEVRNRLAEAGPQSGGFSSTALGSVFYARNRRTVQITGSASTAFRYFEQLDRVSPVSHSAALSAAWELPKHMTLSLDQRAAYSPAYLHRLFPSGPPTAGESIPTAVDYRIDDSESQAIDSEARLSIGARRNRFVVGAQRRFTRFKGLDVPRPNVLTDRGTAAALLGVGRSHRFSAEYEYRASEFGFRGTSIEHRVKVGGEYSKALSSSRRAIVRFNVSPSTLVVPASSLIRIDPTATASRTIYRLEGDALLNYRFKRSWTFEAHVQRGTEYIPVLREPVFRDGGRLEMSGLATRRLDLRFAATAAVGRAALGSDTRSFDTYSGVVHGQFALTRWFAVFTEYLYYYYDLRSDPALAPDLPSVFDQKSLRAGVTLRVQAVGR